MSASAINAAPPPSPGAAGLGGSQAAGATQGQAAGFEALLASFFGLPQQPGAVVPSAKTAAGTAGATVTDGDTATSGDDATTKPAADTSAADAAAIAAAAACNAVVTLPVATAPVAAAPGETVDPDALAQAGAAGTPASKTAGKPAGHATIKDTPLISVAEPALDGAEADAKATPVAIPAGEPAPTTPLAELDPAVATSLTPPEPARLAAPPAQLTPPPAAATVVDVPVDPAPPAIVEAVAAPQAAAGAKAAEPTAPAAPKAQTAKNARNEPARGAAEPVTTLAKAGSPAVAALADGTLNGAVDDYSAKPAGAESKTEAADTPAASADAGMSTASTTNATTQVHPGVLPVRGSPQTVANLAAQIAKKLEGRSTRFDLELNPQGLGRVDVRMEIGAAGRMSAAMTFDTPQAAAELRARAAELQRHLEQAGFDLSGGLSFDVAGDRGQGRQAQNQNQDSDTGQAFRGRAFQEALATADGAAQSAVSGALNLRRSLISGVDVRI